MEKGKDNDTGEKARNVFCFFCFGLLTILYHESLMVALSDSLTKAPITSTAAVLAVGLPQVVLTLVMPWTIQKIPHIFKILLIFILYTSGLLIVVCSEDATVRLAGFALAEAGKSLAELTFLSLTAFYGAVTISAFAFGTGVGCLIGPLYYTASTAWFCTAPRIAITIILPGVLLFLCVYAMLDRNPLREPWVKPPTHEGIKYELLAATDEDWDGKLTWSRRFTIGWLVLPLVIFLYWGFFSGYLTNRAVITSMAFDNTPFHASEHYNYYTLCDRLGEFLGRSYLFVFSYTCASQVHRVRINRTWILAVIGLAHPLFLACVSWYRVIPSVGIIMALCLTQGFLTGAIYLNSPHVVRERISVKNNQEFGLALLIVGVAAGQLAGGLLRTFTDPALEQHCLYALKLKTLCSTSPAKTKGWSENRLCSK